MEGGVAFFLLLILVVGGGGIALFMYLGGGALLAKTDHESEEGEDEPRPVHKTPTSPTQEKVTFAGTGDDPEHRS
jgi:hypothetical protein